MPNNFIPSAAEYIRILPEIILTLAPEGTLTSSGTFYGGDAEGYTDYPAYGAA